MKNKKAFLALVLVSVVIFVGATVAYFTDTIEVPNVFKTKEYGTEVTEEFVSPTDWTPGTTTDKTIVATNTGDTDVAVRISYTESWVSADGTTLGLKQGNNQAAIINFDNTSDWIKEGNYYYYKNKLSKDQSTNSFIKSVTFNENIIADTECTTTGLTQKCTTTKKGYDGATYTLTLKVETVQYDAYQSIWNTNVEIS